MKNVEFCDEKAIKIKDKKYCKSKKYLLYWKYNKKKRKEQKMKINAEMQMVVHTHTHTSNLIKNKVNNEKGRGIMPVCDTG